jgi:hypothetical protein
MSRAVFVEDLPHQQGQDEDFLLKFRLMMRTVLQTATQMHEHESIFVVMTLATVVSLASVQGLSDGTTYSTADCWWSGKAGRELTVGVLTNTTPRHWVVQVRRPHFTAML